MENDNKKIDSYFIKNDKENKGIHKFFIFINKISFFYLKKKKIILLNSYIFIIFFKKGRKRNYKIQNY